MRKRKYVSLQETDHQRVLLTGAGGDERSGENEQQQRLLLTAEEALARGGGASAASFPVPRCHNIVSTSQIMTSQASINLQRLADLFPFTTYDRKRFAAITIRLANPYCTCLLFGSGKLVITGSTSFSACIVASHEITRILRRASPRDTFEVPLYFFFGWCCVVAAASRLCAHRCRRARSRTSSRTSRWRRARPST